LNNLSLKDNPIAEEIGDGLKKEILIALDMLDFKFINKDEVAPEEVEDAANEKKERARQEEEARLAAEQKDAEGEEPAE
jgi:hypothetical protein